jgi:hypothetical protein
MRRLGFAGGQHAMGRFEGDECACPGIVVVDGCQNGRAGNGVTGGAGIGGQSEVLTRAMAVRDTAFAGYADLSFIGLMRSAHGTEFWTFGFPGPCGRAA